MAAVWILTVALLQAVDAATADPARADVESARALTTEQARAEARRTGQPVEILGLRGESREVVANPDGTLSQTTFMSPRWTRQNGAWVRVDTSLVERSDGTLAPKASPLGIVISGGGGPFVRMARLDRELRLTWPGVLPKPAIDGDTAVFASVLPDVDLRVRVEPNGFSHLLVIKTAEAAADPRLASLQLGLAATKLAVTRDGDGLLQATDTASGAGVFEAPSPLMWDSQHPEAAPQSRLAGESEPGVGAKDPEDGPGEASAVAPVGVQVGGGKLTLTPDQGLLTSRETKFPVYVDPSWTARSQDASWAMVSSGFPTQSYYKFSGTEGVGYCSVSVDPNCYKTQIKRLFYRMPLTGVQGKVVTKAEFTAFQTHSYDCSLDTSIRLYRTTVLESSATWNSTQDNWGDHLASRDVSFCSRTGVEFSSSLLTAHVKSAVDKGAKTITFGLRAYREDSMNWWKRFASDAYLRITYNTPPDRPLTQNLSSNPGGVCEWDDKKPTIGRLPEITAVLYDKDAEDKEKVTAQFEMWWDDGTGTGWAKHHEVSVGPMASGSKFTTPFPTDVPEDTVIGWHVRAYDGKQASAWSSAGDDKVCQFVLDRQKPMAPSVTSADYPADEADHGGVGEYGSFTFTPSSTDTVSYQYAVGKRAQEGPRVQAPSPGAPTTVEIKPESAGSNTLSVIAYDGAGNASEAAAYTFKAGPGKAPKAHFRLDEPAGATTVAAQTPDGADPVTATPHEATLGVAGRVGTAMQLNGPSGYAATTGPLLDTTKSFSVAAWVKLNAKDNVGVVASQEGGSGNPGSAFALYYSRGWDRFIFNMQDPTSNDPVMVKAIGKTSPVLGQWAHLMGVYDHVSKNISLYVNGELQATVNQPNAFSSTGPIHIGRFKFTGSFRPEHYWNGLLDDVKIYDRVVTAEQALNAYTEHALVLARWKLNTDGADDSGAGHTLAYSAAGAGTETQNFYLGTGALGLSGGGFAATGDPVMATDQSFTVAGWVQLPSTPSGNQTVFSQASTGSNSGFGLRFAPGAGGGLGGWQIEMPSSDDPGAPVATADHLEYLGGGQWHHVAIVYDAPKAEMTLYVNGAQSTEPASFEGDITSFNALGGFQIGRYRQSGAWSEYLDGAVDDVWVFKGALSEGQIQILSTGVEELETSTVP